jgi:hypothetical protein
MADDKKGPPKGGGKKESKPNKVWFTDPIEVFIVVVIIASIVGKISLVVSSSGTSGFDFVFSGPLDYFSNNILPKISVLSFSLSIVFLFGIVWNVVRLTSLNKTVYATFHPRQPKSGDSRAPGADKNPRWERVLEHLNSTNPNDWKFSILEADIMLSDLLDTLQYRGDTMADKLKAVDKSDFTTIESAWEAHKIRNMVAHTGGDFVLTEREARRVIDLYKDVFNEFKII